MRDQFVQSVAAEDVAHRLQQVDGQLRMPVGEAGVAGCRHLPALFRPASPGALLVALDQSRRFEREQVLARAGERYPQTHTNIGGALRAARLQMKQDAV